MPPGRKTTFKERARKSDLRSRHEASSSLKKTMRLGRRNHNRFDDEDIATRTMDEMVSEVNTGAAIASRDDALDPRGLADLLASLNQDTGKKVLAKLDANDSRALPAPVVDADSTATATHDPHGNNKNRYKHKGGSYVFWERVGLHPLLVQGLKEMKFTHPTPVQEEVLPSVLEFENGNQNNGKQSGKKSKREGEAAEVKKEPPPCFKKDLVVSAETGSGKTLVFALPVLHHLLRQLESEGVDVSVPAEAQAKEAAEGDESNETTTAAAVEVSKEEKPRDSKKRRVEKKKSTNKAEDKEDVLETAAVATPSPAAAVVVGPTKEEKLAYVKRQRKTIMHTLIVSPTRELAIQIKTAMEQLTAPAKHIIRIGCVVGGMAPEKQQRVLNRCPHVLICTPGRLWDLLQRNEGAYLGHSISRRMKFIVLDEADKLLQGGRFEELKKILERIHCDVLPAGYGQSRDEEGQEDAEEPQEDEDEEEDKEPTEEGSLEGGRWDEKKKKFVPFTKEEKQQQKEQAKQKKLQDANEPKEGVKIVAALAKDKPRPMAMPPPPTLNHRVTTMVTSATLSLETNYTRKDLKANKSIIRTSNANTMQAVLQELGIHPKGASIFNMAPQAGVVAKINESFLRCPEDSKDLYLYYFLRNYKERAIVFVNAISMLRRLVNLLEVLGIPVVGLHASMQQRQRIKFVERFKTGDKRVLVATDIASRGIDIEGLRYVIHYQVPRSTDAYIHRCGRTARCGGTGLSVLMVNATEYISYKKLLESMGRHEGDMETFALEPSAVHHLHPHMTLALQIDKLQKEIGKTSANQRWIDRMSKETEIDADDMKDEETTAENRERAKAMKVLKKQLEALTRKETGHRGGKGAFRTGAKALGALEAAERMKQRADRQVLKGAKY